MTGLYVQTNVPSLIARNQLKQNMADLGNILTRLSTGLRINSGKDDPAGLIASEVLKSDMTATSKAIINTQRANSLMSIAESSLGQINNLLNDLKGLVVEAASEGTMSPSQIEANQLQINATLDSIDRIAKTANYLGKPILNGAMDFQTQGVDRNTLHDLKIFQVSLSANAQMDVNIQVQDTATKAQLFYDKSSVSYDTVLEVAGNAGVDMFKFTAGATVQDIATAINSVTDSTGVRAIVGDEATHGQIMLTSAGAGLDNDINLTALIAGSEAGNYTIKFTAGNSTETTYTITEPNGINPGIIEFKLKMEEQKAPSVENFDESFAGIHTYKIPTNRVAPITSAPIPLIIETKNNQLIRQVEYVQTSAASIPGGGQVAVNYNKSNGKLQILYDGSSPPSDTQLETAINAIKDFKYISGGLNGSEQGYVTVYDARPNNMLNIISTVPGLKFENTDIVFIKDNTLTQVNLEYFNKAQHAAATINHGSWASDPSYNIIGRIVAKEKGAQYNDIKITFEHDDTAYSAGEVTAIYDEQTKVLHVRGWIDHSTPATNASYGAIKKAIEDTGLFTVSYTLSNTAGSLNGQSVPLSTTVSSGLATGTPLLPGGMTADISGNNSYIYTGRVAGDIGTNNQVLMITIAEDTPVEEIVKAFNDPSNGAIAANFVVSAAGDGTGYIFDSTLDVGVNVKVYTEVLTGGNNGWETAVTAAELATFINCDPVLGRMFEAALPYGQTGSGKVTLFDEAAYYGNPDDETGLQFLGPKNSPDILFVTDGANCELGISFEPSMFANYDGRPVASLLAQNPNAAFTVRANSAGDEFDNMAIRMIRLDDNYGVGDNYARYISGASNAMAYCSINNGATSGTVNETGKFIIYGVRGGEELNNVSIVTTLDVNQTERVKVHYDDVQKKLVISVNSSEADVADGGITLSEAVAAINDTGIFRADYDYSWNRKNVTDPAGPGIATFGDIFTSSNSVEIGNTGNTGGKNGVLEIYLADEITGQAAVDAINSEPVLREKFYADVLGNGVDAGNGNIDFRNDNIRRLTGSNGKTANEVNMVTVQLGEPYDDLGYMVIHLATDSNGNSITSARDLVDFMNSLTAEETRGISVSVIRPPGMDNLNRQWIYDICDNLTVIQECDDDWGKGILEPTMEIDECDNIIYHPIPFYSYGEQLVAGYPLGNVVAVNGIDASFRVFALRSGGELEGVGFRYVRLVDAGDAMWADYDAVGREIIVYIRDNATANEIASVIETSENTKNLFRVEQLGSGTGGVDLSDDYLVLRDGIYDAGYRGGARMLGATDNDPHRLIFESVAEGTSQSVSVKTILGKFELRDVNGNITNYATGTDTVATVNGIKMKSDGRMISASNSAIQLETVLDETVRAGDSIRFKIIGGGALFQVGPDVVTAHQLRVGIQSVSTANLGGMSGRLYQLRSGNNADLITNNKLADRIIEEAILSISMLRGRLGATQRSTLEPTIASLQDNLTQITTAESQISNADFAEESSRLTRAQILVQAGARTLSIANQLPQYAASLLGG
ncbi:MAG: flagellin [Planctomycetaceae bacterium]|jgi:flagellin-like hook-associated protein FlgL|nr:flagellin [Planctomycetaceae bacterium]